MATSVPSVVEQRTIAQALSDPDAGIAAVEACLAKADNVKQAKMPVLLTGGFS